MESGQLLGKQGEAKAEEILQAKGYQILEKNHRIGGGEIDLIARQGEFIVFVEVKSRRVKSGHSNPLSPKLQMTRKKLAQVRKLAELYLQENSIENLQPRFDFFGLSFLREGHWEIEHIENAF